MLELSFSPLLCLYIQGFSDYFMEKQIAQAQHHSYHIQLGLYRGVAALLILLVHLQVNKNLHIYYAASS
jgi:hypothetical protein